ncbi:hypothetical protein JCM10213_002252 [Rhodosporidiobolus nylandii]
MSVVLRSNTFTIFPEPYLDEAGNPRMPFRRYQTEVWEPWLKQAYSDETQHFLAKPDIQYAKQLDSHLLACAEVVKQSALALFDSNAGREDEAGVQWRLRVWVRKSRKEREDVLLEIWEAGHKMYEKMGSPKNLAEVPEYTLDLAGDQLGPLLRLISACRPPPSFDPSTSPVPHISHPQWDRVWLVGEYEPAVPLSRAKRAFVESAVATRTATLLNFVQLWKLKMQYDGPIVPQPSGPPSPINEQTAPRMLATDSAKQITDRMAANKAAVRTKWCAECQQTENALAAGTKLMCCGRCKLAGRMVWYCGAEHQQKHWRVH